MRGDGNDPHMDISFDCGTSPGALKRTDIPGTNHIRIESLSGSVAKTVTGMASVPQGLNALCINLKGTLLARTSSQGKLVLIPPRSMTFIRGTKLIVQAARGDHQTIVISWQSGLMPLLDHWIVTRPGRSPQSPARVIACRPIDPHFKDAIARFDATIATPNENAEPLVVSFVYEVVARLMTGLDQVQLAALPSDLPETVTQLVAKVRQNPAHPWPLKEAADFAGYSPFHFSRVFKNLVGYGFHEYVDRCRTECAVELLVTTDLPVDLVASQCGFGTTQGLRESVKEYLGLVPSELRAVPEFDPE